MVMTYLLAKKSPRNAPVKEVNPSKVQGNTNKIDESSSLAVTIHNGQETKGSKPSSHNVKEEWVEVKRKKGARSVKFHTNNSISHLIHENLKENSDTNIEAVREDISNGDLSLAMVHNEMDNEMKMGNNQSISHKQAMSQQQEEGAVVNSHVNGDDEVNITEENLVDKSSARNKVVVTVVPSVVPGGIDGSASTGEHNEEMHSSDLQIPEEIAQKISSYSSVQFYCEELGGQVDTRDIYMHCKTGSEDDKLIFQAMDGLVNGISQVLHEGSGIPIKEVERGCDDQVVFHNSDNELYDQGDFVGPSMRPTISILQKFRHRKKRVPLFCSIMS
ncbi:unnamed protein product [Rhodiola kirilowii]